MKQEDFTLALNALLPDCNPEAAAKWTEFAAGCVAHEQFVYYIPMEQDAAVEKWLDATFAGLYAVNQEYGPEIATQVAGLSCQQCALYPSEMLSAAAVLKNGGNAEQVKDMSDSGSLEMNEPFFIDLPDKAALTRHGPEIAVSSHGVPCGQPQKQTEPGYLLADGTALFDSKRDNFGRYWGNVGTNGIYIQTAQQYAPIRGTEGEIKAFQEVKPVTELEQEVAFLADPRDVFALYRLNSSPLTDFMDFLPLPDLCKSGASPLEGSYDLIHVIPMQPGDDPDKMIDACRAVDALHPGDIAVYKQSGVLTCWYVDQLAYSKLPGLLENCLKATIEAEAKSNVAQIDPKRDIEQIIAGMRRETVHEITKEYASPGAQSAWYWTYIGSLDLACMLGLIDDSRRQALYREVEPLSPKNYPVADTSKQVGGTIHHEPSKPSVRDALRQHREDAVKPQGGTASPNREQER